ncbi:MAG: sugar transferase [Candidatus Rokuibacteriota bacterium]|nr:MAG: sugar transferase [Candidatus Rokubacteria bacterium]
METALHTATESTSGSRLESHAKRGRLGLRPGKAWVLACLGADIAMLSVAAVFTAVGGKTAGVASPPAVWMAVFAFFCILLYARRGLYRPHLRLRAADDVLAIVLATTVAAMGVLSLRALLGEPQDVLAESLRPWAFALVYVAAGRVALYWSQSRSRELGESVRPTLIVGAGRVGTLVARRLLDNPDLGLRPVAFLDKEPLEDTQRKLGLPVVGSSWDLDEAVERYGIEQVVVTFSTAPEEVLLRLVRRCEQRGVPVAIVPRLFERMPQRLAVEHLGGLPLVMPKRANPQDWQFDVKYVLDRVVAGAGLLLLSPLLVAVAGAIWMTMGRPIFFRQARIGRDGRMFQMLKFRSMIEPGEGESVALPGPGLAPGGVEGADRRTRLGTFLRRSSIDELPQLINVLRGDMSLVGPRPERPEFVSEFSQSVYRYGDRHRVKSGITGWAQVSGLRGKTSIADRAEWDNFYIENFSLGLDLKIVLMTAGALPYMFRTTE